MSNVIHVNWQESNQIENGNFHILEDKLRSATAEQTDLLLMNTRLYDRGVVESIKCLVRSGNTSVNSVCFVNNQIGQYEVQKIIHDTSTIPATRKVIPLPYPDDLLQLQGLIGQTNVTKLVFMGNKFSVATIEKLKAGLEGSKVTEVVIEGNKPKYFLYPQIIELNQFLQTQAQANPRPQLKISS